jgi:hypothetical protein
MIEELKALAEKVSSPTQLRSWGMEYQAQLVEMLPTILSALEAVPVMKEALEQSEQGWENVVEMGLLPPDHWETANNLFHACSQALAALEGK